MQITLNQAEVTEALQAHVDTLVNLAGDCHITVNEDGTALVIINEEVGHEDDTPPVVEKKTRRRRNPQEAKHRPVEPEPQVGDVVKPAEPEAPTSVGGQSGTTTPEPEAAPETESDDAVDPTGQLREEATAQAEQQEAEHQAEAEAAVDEKVQEAVEVEKPAATKPSLFAGLKNR